MKNRSSSNVSDFLMGFNSVNMGEVDLVTEHSDAIGHSSLVKKGTATAPINHSGDPNGIISVGPDQSSPGTWHWQKGQNSWHTYSDEHSKIWRRTVNVNYERVKDYAKHINDRVKDGKFIYSVELSSCVTHTSRALNISGVFNIGIHPHLLNFQMYLREIGARPMLFLNYFD